MKKFEEKAIIDMGVIQAGAVQNDWKVTAHVGKDDWNCWEVKVDFAKKVS
jgi:hypothetical protein